VTNSPEDPPRNEVVARLVAALAVIALVGGMLAADPAGALKPGELSDEVDYVRRINEIRVANGLRPVVEDVELSTKARNWSIHMANGNCGLIPLCHDPNLASGITSNWTELGENVAYAQLGDNAKVMNTFVNSAMHRRNLLDPAFTRVGVGVIHRNGLQHVTHKFMGVSGEVIAFNAPLSQRYVDVRYDHDFYGDIEWLSDSEIALGNTSRMFRPSDAVSRQEMAAFLYRLAGSPPGPFPNPGFSDVKTSHGFYKEIAWLVASGTGDGFANGTFRPGQSVNRGAAAKYLYGMAGSPAGPHANPGYSDVKPNHLFYKEIAWFASEGISAGYPNGTFGPGAPVSRQAMGKFLHLFDGI
jgi:hypothetical protein